MDFNKALVEKATWRLHKDATFPFGKIMEASPHKTSAVRPPTSHLTNHLSLTDETCCAFGLLRLYTPVLADQQNLKFISSVRTLDAI